MVDDSFGKILLSCRLGLDVQIIKKHIRSKRSGGVVDNTCNFIPEFFYR